MLIMYTGCKPNTADCTVQKGSHHRIPELYPHVHTHSTHRKIITYCGQNGSVKNIQQGSQCVDYTSVELLRSMLL